MVFAIASEPVRLAFFSNGPLLCVRSPATGRVAMFDCGIRSAARSSARLLRLVADELQRRPDAPVRVFCDDDVVHLRIASDIEICLRPVTCSPTVGVALVTHCLHAGVANH